MSDPKPMTAEERVKRWESHYFCEKHSSRQCAECLADVIRAAEQARDAQYARALGVEATRRCPTCIGAGSYYKHWLHDFKAKCDTCHGTCTIPRTPEEIAEAGMAQEQERWAELADDFDSRGLAAADVASAIRGFDPRVEDPPPGPTAARLAGPRGAFDDAE